MRQKRFLCDVDGIVADFVSATIPIMEKLSGRKILADSITTWDVTQALLEDAHREEAKKAFLERGFCTSFDEYVGTSEAIERLNEMLDLYFVTAPMFENPSWMEERAAWLMSRYKLKRGQVNFITDKFIVHGDFLLDDSNTNCELWAKENPFGLAMLWDRPHNRHTDHPSIRRVHSWNEVLQIVESSMTVYNDPY